MNSYVPATSCAVSSRLFELEPAGALVLGSVSAIGETRASYWPTNTRAPTGDLNVTVALFAPGAAKSGSGLVSDSTPDVRPEPLVALAPPPRPRLANAAHRSFTSAPPNRIWSA